MSSQSLMLMYFYGSEGHMYKHQFLAIPNMFSWKGQTNKQANCVIEMFIIIEVFTSFAVTW